MANTTTSQIPLISTILGLVGAYGAAKGIPAIDNATLTSIAPYVSGALGGLGVAAGGGTGIAPIDNIISKVVASPQAATVNVSLDKSVKPTVAAAPLAQAPDTVAPAPIKGTPAPAKLSSLDMTTAGISGLMDELTSAQKAVEAAQKNVDAAGEAAQVLPVTKVAA